MRLITLLVLEIVLDLSLNIISWYHAQSYARNDPTDVFNRTVCQIPEPIGGRKNKWNGRRMVNLKGILNLISSSMRFTFMTNNINFNSTVIWSQFSTVAVFFLLKMSLSHVQVSSKVYMSELNFYLSRKIGHRFWRTLTWCDIHLWIQGSLDLFRRSSHTSFHLIKLKKTKSYTDGEIKWNFLWKDVS